MRIFSAVILVAALTHAATAAEYYVSLQGNDANAGTMPQPFATLARAQQAARRLAGREAVHVFVREGTHYLGETLVFSAEDSGTQAAPVVYQAFEQEQAVLSGGVRLKDLQWQPFHGGILQAKLPAGFNTDQLFVNGERQTMARYPNFNRNERVYNGSAADAISPQRVAHWRNPAGGFIHALHGGEWGGMHYLITGKDADNKIAYEGGWQNNRPSGMHGKHRFVENILEELDAPGEWFLDAKQQLLYFYPPVGVDLKSATVEAVRLRQLVELRGTQKSPVRFVRLQGLTFRHAARTFMDTKEPLLRSDWTIYRGGAVYFHGTEDCALADALIEQIGGNAVFVNSYNRRVTLRGCHVARAGGSGVAFVGDAQAVRNPLFQYGQEQKYADLDNTPGPKTDNYPAECLVDDCLIYQTGQVEKQSAGITIDMAQGITIRRCSIYDVPRAGINIGDGCWGGHAIEYCDVFDTVQETGDHGSFNSWGRDRFWGSESSTLNDDRNWSANKAIVLLDAVKTNVIRNSRWRCDHGWDIDLDDGSTNYHIYNNLCLHGGLKNREGFHRVVENNILFGGFHPHVWYKHSEDIVRRNIMMSDQYLPAGGMPDTPWGQELDDNLVHRAGAGAQPATKLAGQSKRDQHSLVADAKFVDAERGDFRVQADSPALKLGFVNFPMDQFGVQKPQLKAIARTPKLPGAAKSDTPTQVAPAVERPGYAWQARMRNVVGPGERSAYGLPAESGVLVLHVPAGSTAAKAGLQPEDVIVACNDKPVRTLSDLWTIRDNAAGTKLMVSLIRKQMPVTIDVIGYAFVAMQYQTTPDFNTTPLFSATAVSPVKVIESKPHAMNEPLQTLTDGRLARNYGPVFSNKVLDGKYKLDLGAATSIAAVNSFSYNQGNNRGRQRFVLYGSAATSDPLWNVDDSKLFTPLIAVDTLQPATADFVATSIRRGDGQPLGEYRWLVWAIAPVTSDHLENTAFQELQVIPAPPDALENN